MKRKVIQIADSTLLVSMPKKWADEQNIKKGDEVDVLPEGTKLVISTQTEPRAEKISIRLNDSEKFLRRSIDVLYRYGYDEIEVTFKDTKVAHLVQECLEELMGFEVVDQSPSSCVIRDIASGREMELDSILRRVYYMISEHGKNVYAALAENDKLKIAELAKYDTLVNKFTNFCERLLNKKGYKEYKKTTLVYYVVCVLEEIADEYKDICKYVVNNKSYNTSPAVLKIHKETNEHFKEFLTLFYKFNYEGLYQLKKTMQRIEKDIQTHLRSNDGKKDAIILYNYMAIIKLIRHMSARIV